MPQKRDEYELKQLLNLKSYSSIVNLLSGIEKQTIIQTNHYYDTHRFFLNSNNTTCRIREINGQFQGTIKKHISGERSEEFEFDISFLPKTLLVDGMTVYSQGCATTERTIIPVSNTVTLFLDKTEYLGRTDYELEIEYEHNSRKCAEFILTILLNACNINRTKYILSKSQRFFLQRIEGETDEIF